MVRRGLECLDEEDFLALVVGEHVQVLEVEVVQVEHELQVLVRVLALAGGRCRRSLARVDIERVAAAAVALSRLGAAIGHSLHLLLLLLLLFDNRSRRRSRDRGGYWYVDCHAAGGLVKAVGDVAYERIGRQLDLVSELLGVLVAVDVDDLLARVNAQHVVALDRDADVLRVEVLEVELVAE